MLFFGTKENKGNSAGEWRPLRKSNRTASLFPGNNNTVVAR